MRRSRSLRINRRELVMVVVSGQVAHPIASAFPYRIGNDGVPRVLPGTGGIVLNHRIGSSCVGLAGDHIEPGVTLHNNLPEITGGRNGPNLALVTYACVGNRVRISSGPCSGQWGIVTGKHGGIDHLIVDFPPNVLRRMNIGDRVQVYSCGIGMRLIDYPEVTLFNCSPGLLRRWGIRQEGERLIVPVSHRIPSQVMGSGLGKNTVWRGDYDIQLFDRETRKKHQLDSLRFGDMVAIDNADTRFGPSYKRGWITLAVVVHSDSTVSGHGPGVAPLLCGPANIIIPQINPDANLAALYRVRALSPAVGYVPLAGRSGIEL